LLGDLQAVTQARALVRKLLLHLFKDVLITAELSLRLGEIGRALRIDGNNYVLQTGNRCRADAFLFNSESSKSSFADRVTVNFARQIFSLSIAVFRISGVNDVRRLYLFVSIRFGREATDSWNSR
jgi:hypothetical protein